MSGQIGGGNVVHNARVLLVATAAGNLGVAAIAGGIVAPMVSGQIRLWPSVVGWSVVGIDFIALAWIWLGRLR